MSRILGYANRLSVAPGEPIKVMVSCDGLDTYNAELIRVIQGDINPDGPGYREEPIEIDVGGPFKGRHQPIHTGSYAVVPDSPAFNELSSLTVQAFVWPTLPGHGSQTVLSREDPKLGTGFRLYLDENGAIAFAMSALGGNSCVVSTEKPLIATRWYLVSASYDAETGSICVAQHPLKGHPLVNDAGVALATTSPNQTQVGTQAPIIIAARASLDCPAQEHFNGRIEAPRVCARAMEPSNMVHRVATDDSAIVAAWDFSIDISTNQIMDISPGQRHGYLVNLPTRAVPGQAWNGEEHCWSKQPEHYGAIHFHDDDLYDCGWDVDFELTIPDDLPSAVYAFRLKEADENYYIPFAVRPPRGTTTAPVAFLMPTASYMAYANNRIGLDVPETEVVCGRLIETASDRPLHARAS